MRVTFFFLLSANGKCARKVVRNEIEEKKVRGEKNPISHNTMIFKRYSLNFIAYYPIYSVF